MSDELKPCPFCGGEPEFWSGGCAEYYGHEHQDVSIDCHSCSLSVRVETGQDKDGNTNKGFDLPCSCCHDITGLVVKKWNTRAQPSDGALTNEGAEPVAIIERARKIEQLRGAFEQRFKIDIWPVIDWLRNSGLYRSPTAQASVVLPERYDESQYRGTSLLAVRRWNACLDRVKELNKP